MELAPGSSWFKLFKTAIAISDYEPEDPLELNFKTGETIHIAGKRNEDWYIGTIFSNKALKWGLFPATFVNLTPTIPLETKTTKVVTQQSYATSSDLSTSDLSTFDLSTELSTATARRELHEYYYRHHRDKIHKLDDLLILYSGNYSSLYQGLQTQFGISPTHLPHSEVDLEAPRQIGSLEERVVQLTWSTREMYSRVYSPSQQEKFTVVIALKYQDVLLSTISTDDSDDWHLIIPSDSLRMQIDSEIGTTKIWLTGLFPGCEYKCRLILYNLETYQEVECRSSTISHFRTLQSKLEPTTAKKGHRHHRRVATALNTSSISNKLNILVHQPQSQGQGQGQGQAPAVPSRKSRQYLPIPSRRHSAIVKSTSLSPSSNSISKSTKKPPIPRRKIPTPTPTSSSDDADDDDSDTKPPSRPPRPTSRSKGDNTTESPPIIPERLSQVSKSKKQAKLLYLGFCELLSTEQKYVSDMTFLVSALVHPLQNQNSNKQTPIVFGQNNYEVLKTPNIHPVGLHAIFGNLEQLVGVNNSFLEDLKQIRLPASTDSFGHEQSIDINEKINLKNMEIVWSQVSHLVRQTWPFFRAYKTYSAGHGNRDMNKWYEETEGLKIYINTILIGKSLESELIKPIQRILKYSLFVRDALKNISNLNIIGEMESAMSAVDSISSEVNASLEKNEKDKRLIDLWNKLNKQPADFLQPGRSLINVFVAEVAPAMNGGKGKGYNWCKRKEYLICILSDIILFARPNKKFHRFHLSSRTTNTLDGSDGNTEPTHHVKMIARMTDIKVTETYARTQDKGECGFELRVLGTIKGEDMKKGFSPYNAYAIWCETEKDKKKCIDEIKNALSAKLAAFFSRKKVNPLKNHS
tara:strand:+ start:82 stop:2670 length:2589 start_codon:yes stop_codon:yes gene_type:complete